MKVNSLIDRAKNNLLLAKTIHQSMAKGDWGSVGQKAIKRKSVNKSDCKTRQELSRKTQFKFRRCNDAWTRASKNARKTAVEKFPNKHYGIISPMFVSTEDIEKTSLGQSTYQYLYKEKKLQDGESGYSERDNVKKKGLNDSHR